MEPQKLQELADALNQQVGKFLSPEKLEAKDGRLIVENLTPIGLMAPSMIHTYLAANGIIFTEIRTHNRTIEVFFTCPPPMEVKDENEA